MAFVLAIHSFVLSVNVCNLASLLKWSKSTTLKSGLYINSQVPKNSRVVRERNQFLITSAARLASVRAFAISDKLL
jgi:hypothetical protein